MNGLNAEATKRAIERGQRDFFEAFGAPARGFLAPAWQRGHLQASNAKTLGLAHTLGFLSVESCEGTIVPLATFTWDCGRWGALGRVGHLLGRLLQRSNQRIPMRSSAIELAVIALAKFHEHGFTHGDAMAENVLVDLKGAAAKWFDFETIHTASRERDWRRADDVRALLSTILLRTIPGERGATLRLVLNVYANAGVTEVLATHFTSVFRRALVFHLGQSGLSLECFREIDRLLRNRATD